MALRKTGKYADSIATPNGIYSKDGVLLLVNDNSFYVHSKEFMDAWNEVKKPAVKKEAVIKPKKVAVAPKKKKAWYKK